MLRKKGRKRRIKEEGMEVEKEGKIWVEACLKFNQIYDTLG